jgi:hypothetical protein
MHKGLSSDTKSTMAGHHGLRDFNVKQNKQIIFFKIDKLCGLCQGRTHLLELENYVSKNIRDLYIDFWFKNVI